MHSVVELGTFLRAAEREGLSDDERMAIVDLIASNPARGEVMQGTGGCRKLRVAGRGFGKSGGYRVITFFAGQSIPTFLITIYGKGTKANLSKAERNVLAGLTAELTEAYSQRIVPLRRKL